MKKFKIKPCLRFTCRYCGAEKLETGFSRNTKQPYSLCLECEELERRRKELQSVDPESLSCEDRDCLQNIEHLYELRAADGLKSPSTIVGKDCKFCGEVEGAKTKHSRTGVVHINKGFCARCTTLFSKMNTQPDKVTYTEKRWFVDTCEFNHKNGLFVPARMRMRMRMRCQEPWRCQVCGRSEAEGAEREKGYVNHCVACAEEIRCTRRQPPRSMKKRRSDAGKPRNKSV